MVAYTSLAIILIAAVQNAAAYNCDTHTYGTCADNIVHWYDPDDGMICDPLDCGGGQAPAKRNNPCCPAAYTGTAVCVSTPSYMPCFTPAAMATPPVATPQVLQTPSTTTMVYEAPLTTTYPSPSSSVAAPIQTTVAAPAQTFTSQLTSETQTTSMAQITSTPQTTITVSSITTLSSILSATTSRASQAGSSSTRTSATAASNTNAAGSVRGGSVMALAGLAMGIIAGI